jgi:hypothetical protein
MRRPSARMVAGRRIGVEGRVGFEPTTGGLKVPCSTAELPARPRPYHVAPSALPPEARPGMQARQRGVSPIRGEGHSRQSPPAAYAAPPNRSKSANPNSPVDAAIGGDGFQAGSR